MKLSSSILVILGFVALASCEVFFEEKFLDGKRDDSCCWVLAGDDGEKLKQIMLITSIFQRQQFD